MAHDDGNLAGSEGNPIILGADDCSTGSSFHCLLDQSQRLALCEELQPYYNSTETKESPMYKMSDAVIRALQWSARAAGGKALETVLNVGGQTPQNSFAAFQQFLRSRSFGRKQPKPYKRKVPRTQCDYFMLERAERKRERKAAKLAAQGFGTVSFLMPDDPFLMAAAEGGSHASSN